MSYTSIPERISPSADKESVEYTVKWGEYLHEYDNTSNGYMNSDRREIFKELRAYGHGSQSIEKYMDLFSIHEDKATNQRKGLNSLDYSIVPVAPKIINSLVSILDNKNTKANVIFTNSSSSEQKEDEKGKLWIQSQYGDKLNAIAQKRGLKPKQPEYLPKTPEDLNLYADAGGIKLQQEVIYETALSTVFENDLRWKYNQGTEIKRDLAEIGFGGTISSINPATKKIEEVVVKGEDVVIDNSSKLDYSDAEFFGIYRDVSIMDIFKSFAITNGRKMDKNEFKTIQDHADHKSSFKSYNYDDYFNTDWYDSPITSTKGISDTKCTILDFVYLVTDIEDNPSREVKKHYIKDKSKVRNSEIEKGKIKKDINGNYYKEIRVQKDKLHIKRWRRGKYVLGTNIAYDYGLVFNQQRDEFNSPITPFNIRRVATKPVLEVVKPNLDAIQLSCMKIQNLKATANGYSIDVDIDALTNVMLGSDKYSAKELVKMGKLSGVQFYRTTTPGSPGVNKGSQARPITEREGGMGRMFLELIQDIEFNIKMIQDNSGLNDVVLASNPNPEVTLGQSQLAATASSRAIDYLFASYSDIKSRIGYSILLRLQTIALHKDLRDTTPYRMILGERNWDFIKKWAKKDIREMSVRVAETPPQNMIEYLTQMINISLQGGKNGNSSITPHIAFRLIKMINDGVSLDYVSLLLKKYEDEAEQKAQENQKALIQEQSQASMQQLGMKQQGDMKSMQTKTALEAKKEMAVDKQSKDLELRNMRYKELQDASDKVRAGAR